MKTIRAWSVLLCLLLLALVCAGAAWGGETETVFIEEGGHYASGPYFYMSSADLWVNMTVVSGGKVDVYVMTMDQYDNAYPESGAPQAISYKNQSVEDVDTAALHIELDTGSDYLIFEEEIMVVVDNRDCSVTPDDATPSGTVQATLEVDWQADDYYDVFPDLLPCIVGLIIGLVVVLALVFLVLRSTRARREREAKWYQQHPPQYWQPPQQGVAPPPTPPAEQPPVEETLDPRFKEDEGQ